MSDKTFNFASYFKNNKHGKVKNRHYYRQKRNWWIGFGIQDEPKDFHTFGFHREISVSGHQQQRVFRNKDCGIVALWY